LPAMNFYDLTLEQLREYLGNLGEERFRADQLFAWVYEKEVPDFAGMSNLPKQLRAALPGYLSLELPAVIERRESRDGTIKLLLDVGEAMSVESVLIPAEGRVTLCLSTEVGCNLACKFCYTGKRKLEKRLSAGQIVGQFLQAKRVLPPGGRITNVVFMGMGEPLDNPEALFASIQILADPAGSGFSRKRITVSTAGLVPMIPRVTAMGTRLAVSLNGSNNATRSAVMPINKKYPLEEVLEACRTHARQSGDKVTFEYVLLQGVTDSVAHARELYRLTRSVPGKINLIPFNEHPDAEFSRPRRESVFRFKNELIRLGADVFVRRTMGRDIYAACGQLTSKFPEHPGGMPPEQFEKSGYSIV